MQSTQNLVSVSLAAKSCQRPTTGPVVLDLQALKQVTGGSPKGGWSPAAVQPQSPKGGW